MPLCGDSAMTLLAQRLEVRFIVDRSTISTVNHMMNFLGWREFALCFATNAKRVSPDVCLAERPPSSAVDLIVERKSFVRNEGCGAWSLIRREFVCHRKYLGRSHLNTRMTENLANNATTTLAASCGYSDTTITVSSATGFPSPNFRIVIDSEIMLVTSVSSTNFTVSRGAEGTTASGHTVGATVANVLTVAGLSAAVNQTVNPELGVANGIATLNGSGQLSSAQIPSSLVGAVDYQGLWNASTNSPTLVSSTGTKGNYYVVSTSGTTTLDGISSWNVGDTAIFSGSVWDKIDGISSEVVSVAGRTGAVVLSTSDVSGLGTAATHASTDFASSSTTVSTSSPLSGGGALTGNLSLSIPQANTSTDGYLAHGDWNTFNAKGSGTVTSVGLTVPNVLSVSGSPVTTSGSLAVSLATQSANVVFAGPTTGSAAAPTFRSLVAADLPSSGSVTSVGMTVPSVLSVSGSPVTSSGTLAVSLATQSANTVFSGPSSGSATAPTFRSLLPADTTQFKTDSGSGATFSTMANVLYVSVNNGHTSGTITLPTGANYASTLVIDNTANSDNYAATIAVVGQTWNVAAGSITIVPVFRSGTSTIAYPYVNYPTTTTTMAGADALYYPSGTELADNSGNLYYDYGGMATLLSANNGNLYAAGGTTLCDGSGQIFYADGTTLADADANLYWGGIRNNILALVVVCISMIPLCSPTAAIRFIPTLRNPP